MLSIVRLVERSPSYFFGASTQPLLLKTAQSAIACHGRPNFRRVA